MASKIRKAGKEATDRANEPGVGGIPGVDIVDPFGYGPRAPYAAEMAALRLDPSQIEKTPGYQAGLQAVTRKMASQGYLGSGNMMAALAEYGGSFYDREMARLASISGVGMSPMAVRRGGGSSVEGMATGADLASRALATLGYGARGLESWLMRG